MSFKLCSMVRMYNMFLKATNTCKVINQTKGPVMLRLMECTIYFGVSLGSVPWSPYGTTLYFVLNVLAPKGFIGTLIFMGEYASVRG